MASLSLSATKMLPPASVATPHGVLNCAFVPVASMYPGEDPASVVTKPPGDTTRMRWFALSPTTTFPLASKATPKGPQKDALFAAPSANAGLPLPASVLTTTPPLQSPPTSGKPPVGFGLGDGLGEALAEPEGDAEAEPVAEAVAEGVAVPLAPTQRSDELLHAHPAAHCGAASRRVQAGPKGTARGHHAPAGAAPQVGGASTAAAAREVKVKAALGAQRAAVAPWQESAAAAHSRPATHSVAARGPE